METTARTVDSGGTPIFDELVGRFGLELPAEPAPVPPTSDTAADESGR